MAAPAGVLGWTLRALASAGSLGWAPFMSAPGTAGRRDRPKRSFKLSRLSAPLGAVQQGGGVDGATAEATTGAAARQGPNSLNEAGALAGAVATAVLGGVTERHGVSSAVACPTVFATSTAGGFPRAVRRAQGSTPFGRRRAAQRKQAATTTSATAAGRDAATAVSGTTGGIAEEIHAENVARLNSMSPQEIRDAQREIREMLPSDLLRAMERRASARKQPAWAPCPSSSEMHRTALLEGGAVPATTIEPASAAPESTAKSRDELTAGEGSASTHPNSPMAAPSPLSTDQLESAKLEWTTMPADGAAEGGEGGPEGVPGQSWRFGFDGRLLADFKATSLRSPELFHHGLDPSQAGYTLDEISGLIRSTVPNQRVMGLQLTAAIIQRACDDHAAGSTQQPSPSTIIDTFMDRHVRLPLLLRRAADDSHVGVIRAAVQAIHGLLVDKRDTTTWSVLALEHGGWRPLTLGSNEYGTGEPSADEEASSTLGNQEDLCFQDLVAGFIRMGLLPRLRYLLEMGELPQACLMEIIRVLRRCSQHSAWAAEKVSSCPRLLKWLSGECAKMCREPPCSGQDTWLIECCILLRELCNSTRAIASQIWQVPGMREWLSRLICDRGHTKRGGSAVDAVCCALRVWQSLLRGCPQAAGSAFMDLYPILSSYINPSKFVDTEAQIASALLGAFETLCEYYHAMVDGDALWTLLSGTFKDGLWCLQEIHKVLQGPMLPSMTIQLVASLLHFMASYTEAIFRWHVKHGTGTQTYTALLGSTSVQALLERHALPCVQAASVQSILQTAAAVDWVPHEGTVVTRLQLSCPRLMRSACAKSAELNLASGAIRWLYYSAALQTPDRPMSKAFGEAVQQLASMAQTDRLSWSRITADAVDLHCQRIVVLFRIFLCRVVLMPSLERQLDSQQIKRIAAVSLNMLHWLGPSDEKIGIAFASDTALQPDSLSALQAIAIENGCPAAAMVDVASMRNSLLHLVGAGDAGATDELILGRQAWPLRKLIFMLPWEQQATKQAVHIARAKLQLFMLLEFSECSYGSSTGTNGLNLADSWCFLCRILLVSESTWQDEVCGLCFDAIAARLESRELTSSARLSFGDDVTDNGLGEFGSPSELLELLLRTYGEDSFGDPRLGRCLTLFLRADQPTQLRKQVWAYCVEAGGTLLDLLDFPADSSTARAVKATSSEEFEVVRIQLQALLTPSAAAISTAKRAAPMYGLAIANLVINLAARSASNLGPDSCDDGDVWEREHLLSELNARADASVLRDVELALSSRTAIDIWYPCHDTSISRG